MQLLLPARNVACQAAILALFVALSACGAAGSLQTAAQARLIVLDSAGRPLPEGSARLVATAGSVEIWAQSTEASGFIYRYDQARLHPTLVVRGEYFANDDLYLAVSRVAGRVDIGGYHFQRPELPQGGGLLVARIILGPGPAREVSTLPLDASCTPQNFALTDNGDGSVTFTWGYLNTGDYSQDGEVNISDLTPVGVHFAKTSSAPDWLSASLADGDSNGEVNIADLTPIGQNYLTLISGYKLEEASGANGPFSEVADIAQSSGVKAPRMAFGYDEPAPTDGGFYRVRAYSSADPSQGAACDPLQVNLLPPGINPVAVPGADVTSGEAPLTVNFNASSSHDDDGSIVKYEWDFDGNNSFDLDATSTGGAAPHIYTTAGTYLARLRVTDDSSRTGVATIQISANEPPPPPDSVPPTAFAYVMPDQGWGPLDIALSPFGSSDNIAITSWKWDLDNDGTFETDATGQQGYANATLSTPGLHTITLQTADSSDNTATASVQVNVRDASTWDVPYDLAFPQNQIIRVDITVSQANWDAMNVDPQAELEVPADAVVNGIALPNLGLSFKGNSSLNNPFPKKPLKFDIDKYDTTQEYYNMKALIFNNAFKDPSLVRETLAYRLYNRAGCWASHTCFCEMYIKIGASAPEYFGVYTMLERVDNKFTGNRCPDDTGNLYKAYMGADLVYKGGNINTYPKYNGEPVYAKKNNETAADWGDVLNLIDVIDSPVDASYPAALESVFDVDSFLRYLSVTLSLCNLDMYVYMSQNYYLYDDPSQGNKFVWIPWDLNETWGLFGSQSANQNHPLFAKANIGMGDNGGRPLFTNLMQVPQYRQTLAAYYDLFRRYYYDYDSVRTEAQGLHDFIRPSVIKGDQMPYSIGDFDTNWDTDYTGGGGPGGFPAFGIAHFTQLRNNYVDANLLNEL